MTLTANDRSVTTLHFIRKIVFFGGGASRGELSILPPLEKIKDFSILGLPETIIRANAFSPSEAEDKLSIPATNQTSHAGIIIENY